jgi:hypothetical protein
MRSGRTRYGADRLKVPAIHRDGRRLSVEFRVALLRGRVGRLIGIAALLRDATQAWNERQAERRQLLERLDALERGAPKASTRPSLPRAAQRSMITFSALVSAARPKVS